MAMTTVNLLGNTPREQWLNAISILDMTIGANLQHALNVLVMDDADDGEAVEAIKAADRVLADYTAEMRRLVEAVFE